MAAFEHALSVSTASATSYGSDIKRIKTDFFAPVLTTPATMIGGAYYRRASQTELSGFPASSYFRSTDRYLPNGTIDNTYGGYWVYDDDNINPDALGALRDDTTDCTSAFNDSCTLAYLTGKSVSPRAGGTYRINSNVSIRWGVSVTAEKGARLRMSGYFDFVNPFVTSYPALFVFSKFSDIRFIPDGVVAYAIKAVSDFNNSSGPGLITGLSIQDCQFIAADADIYAYRSSPDNYFINAVYMSDVAFSNYSGNTFVGGFEVTSEEHTADQESSRAIVFDGQSIRFTWDASNNVQSYCYGIEGKGQIEGFVYEGGEMVYCRRGIHVDTSNIGGGARIKSGHFNVSERGIYFKNRKGLDISGINVWRNSSYEDRTDWVAVELDSCLDGIVSGVSTQPSGLTNYNWVIKASNCQRLNLNNIVGRYNTYIVGLYGSTDIRLDLITGDSGTAGVVTDSSCNSIHIGEYSFTNIPNPLAINSSTTNVYLQVPMGRPDGAVTPITTAGSEVVSASNSWIRRQFSGSSAYTYDVNLPTSAYSGTEIKMSLRIDGSNPTVKLYDGASNLILTLPNVASGTRYFTAIAKFNGSTWRYVGCWESLV